MSDTPLAQARADMDSAAGELVNAGVDDAQSHGGNPDRIKYAYEDHDRALDALIAAAKAEGRAEERERGFGVEQTGNAWLAVRCYLRDYGHVPSGTFEEASAIMDAQASALVDLVVAELSSPTTEEAQG